jgi:hypothetical protein
MEIPQTGVEFAARLHGNKEASMFGSASYLVGWASTSTKRLI